MGQKQKTIIEYIDDYLEYLDVEKGLSLKSQETYARFIKKFAFWLEQNGLAHLAPSELKDRHLWNYRVFLSRTLHPATKEPLKRSTQNYYLIALRGLLSYLADRDVRIVPATKLKLLRQKDERAVKFLTLDQLKQLLAAPDPSTKTGLRDRAILEMLFSTGLRVAELASINRDQFKITPQTTELEIVVVGKGNRPRPVYVSERAVNALRSYLHAREDKDKALFIGYKGPKTESRRLTTRSLENIIKKYVVKAGLPIHTSPHSIRHSFATDLLSKGVDLRALQEFLGHKNIGTTQIYAHVTNRRLRDIHKKYHSGDELSESPEEE